jgi:hypothetical protein
LFAPVIRGRAGKPPSFGTFCRKLKIEHPKLRKGVTLAKTEKGRMPTTTIRGDKHRKRKNMPKNTNRAASRHMREIAKAKAKALELKARMYAAGIWPVIPPPLLIAELQPERVARLIANLKEAGRWPLPSEHPASAILTQRENEGNKMSNTVAVTEAQFPSKATADNEASRASLKRGRKPVVTAERINTICELLTRGESERSACIRAGIGSTAWGVAKRNSADLRERIARARDQWAQLQHARHTAALHESQATRSANRKALKPQPTHQAKLVIWHLIYRVPLYWAAIPDTEIAKACERFNLPLETWWRQESAFGLLKKVYARRAQLRGQQPLNGPVANAEQPTTARPASNAAQQEPPAATESSLYHWWLNAKRASDEDDEPPIRPDDGLPRLL